MARQCPQCKAPVDRASKAFPFCSDRCRSLDLGAWASERYTIAGSPATPEDVARSVVENRRRNSDDTIEH